MGYITNLQERIRELESVNRLQAVEISELKEKNLQLEKKVESLLNSNTESGSQTTHATEAARPIPFGPILFSDGSTSRLMDGTTVDAESSNSAEDDGDVFGDVEEVNSVTLEGLSGGEEDIPHLASVTVIKCLFFRWRQLLFKRKTVFAEGGRSLGGGAQYPH